MNGGDLKNTDTRSELEYVRGFNGPETPDVNALLSVFQASLNVLDKLLPLDTDPSSQQTILKLKYLSTHHVLHSLEILLTERATQLRPASVKAIKAMIEHPTAKLMTAASKGSFRNTLMHYGPDSRIDLTQLSLGQPLYGLVEQCFSMDMSAFDEILTSLISHVAAQMNAWAHT